MNSFKAVRIPFLAMVATIVAAAGIPWALAQQQADNLRPRQARISGNTWCGPVNRGRNDPLYGIYEEVARLVDSGAQVIAYSENESDGSETFVLCGRIQGRAAP